MKPIKLTMSAFGPYANETVVKLAKQNLGIGWGLKKFIEDEINSKNLYEIPINFKTPKAIYSISYEEKMLNNTSILFLNYFKENIQKILNNKN